MLTAYLGFEAGGFFAGSTGRVAVVLAIVLLLRITLCERPFDGLGLPLALAAGALGLYAVWSLLSAQWSNAPARAMVEFDRALLYWLALVLFGSMARRAERVEAAVRGVALALVVVCGAGLASRVLPEVFPVEPGVATERLSFPITYWNVLGLLASFGLILCLHLTSSARERAAVKVAAAAASPVLACALYFTFSRGGIAAGILGLVLYVVVVHPRGAVPGLLATVPATAAALIACYQADLLSTDRPTIQGAVEQGQNVALVIAGCVLAAALLRALLLTIDRRLAGMEFSPARQRRLWGTAIGGVAVAMLLAVLAFDAPAYVERQTDRFVQGGELETGGDLRGRLTDAGNNGRLDNWQVAIDDFRGHPVIGTGAGTYSISWARERERSLKVEDAHSLYLESLSELGLIGGILIVAVVVSLLMGFLRALRAERLSVYGALLAAGVAWAFEAGLDWVWEMPVATLWLFALGGMCLARPAAPALDVDPRRFARVATGAGLLALATTPVLIALSQSHLDESTRAFKRGDCTAAIESGLASVEALGVRPEPYLVLGLCDARLGEDELAVQAMGRAVSLDPEGWRSHYGLALARASAGLDPRPAALQARRLNPRSELTTDIVKRFDTDDPRKWKRRARGARLFRALSGD